MRGSSPTKARKYFTIITAIICVLSLMVGTFAHFIYRESRDSFAVAGNIDLVFYDISASKTGTNGITSNNAAAIDGSWKNSIVADGGDINPGEYFDLSYELVNEGNKSMDVRQQLIVTSNVPMTENAEEFTLTISDSATIVPKCLYNGVALPELPEYDSTAYPYLTIGYHTGMDMYLLTVQSSKLVSDGSSAYAVNDSTNLIYMVNGNEWEYAFTEEIAAGEVMADTSIITIVWSSEDIEHTSNGSVLYEGSEPVQANVAEFTSPVVGTLSNDGLSITYNLEDVILNGTGQGAETEEGIESNRARYTIRFDFSETADEAFMGCEVGISMSAQAKQHRNTTDADWVEWGEVESNFEQVISSSPGTDSPIKFGEIYGIDMGGGMAGTLVAYENGSAIVQVYNNGTLANRMSAPAGYLTYSGTQVIAEGLEFATVSADGNSIDASGSIGGVFTLGSPFDTPIHFGETYVVIPGEGQAATLVLQPDGSAEVKYYQNGVVANSLSRPAGFLTYSGTQILSSGVNFGSVSADGKAIDATTTLGDVYILDPYYVEPEPVMAAGLYETGTDTMLTSWDDLLADGTVHVENGVVYTNYSDASNSSSTALAGDLVLPADGSITAIGDFDASTQTGNMAFALCDKLTSVVIPETVTSISPLAFGLCTNLTSVSIPEGITTIEQAAFYGCSKLASVELPSTLETIGKEAFAGTVSLTEIDFPDGLSSIGEEAFNASGVTNIVIPSSMREIGEKAFKFANVVSVTLPEGLETIGDYAFQYCEEMISINLPDTLKSVGTEAFRYCDKLDGDLVIPNSVTSVGRYAFSECFALDSVTWTTGMTTIPEGVFDYCTSLTEFVVPANVTTIENGAFSFCFELENITLNEGLETLDKAFSGCSKLSNIVIPSTVRNIADGIFSSHGGLHHVEIRHGLTEIPRWSFKHCYDLESIVIPSSVTTIGSQAFTGCDKLTDIYYTGTQSEWEAISNAGDIPSLPNVTIHYNYAP